MDDFFKDDKELNKFLKLLYKNNNIEKETISIEDILDYRPKNIDSNKVLSQTEIDSLVKELINTQKEDKSLNQEEIDGLVEVLMYNRKMNIKEKALLFACNAHKGQIRKSEPDTPKIVHPMAVGKMLEEYGYDDNVVAAGYLHDVVEDCDYSFDDIKKLFGEDIKDLVYSASEEDKSLPWKDRKKHTIDAVKNLPLRKKLVVAADKINNLETLYITFRKKNDRDFSCFNAKEDMQKWYYTEIYKSLIHNEDENLEIFKRLKTAIDNVFTETDDKELRNIFIDDQKYYNNLIILDGMKDELTRLRDLCEYTKPFVIEFAGTPRTGKTTSIRRIEEFFNKSGFNCRVVEEYTTSREYKEKYSDKPETNEDIIKRNMDIQSDMLKQLDNALTVINEEDLDTDIIIVDRSLNDRIIWNYRLYIEKILTKEQYYENYKQYMEEIKKRIDFLAMTYCKSKNAIKRDYLNSLSLKNRSFLNMKNVSSYNDALLDVYRDLGANNDLCFINTDKEISDERDTAIIFTKHIMSSMKKKYLNKLR